MADIDIFELQPNVVSKDLKGKIVCFYGAYKSGKTFNACKFPKPLLLACEKGYSAIAGIKAAKITKWAEIKKVVKQLEDEQAHELFETVILDTADIAYALCEEFVCQRENVSNVSDIAWGKGYKMVRDEFFKVLRKIAMLDFGLIMISHSVDKTIKLEDGTEFTKTVSTLGDRPKEIVFGMADIVGFSKVAKDKEGKEQTYLMLKETMQWEAGSRWKLPPYILFSYENLVNVLADAVAEVEQEFGSEAVVDKAESVYKEEKLDFDKVMKEVKGLCKEIMGKGDYLNIINEITEEHLGKGTTIKYCTKEQVDILSLICDDLKTALNKIESGNVEG